MYSEQMMFPFLLSDYHSQLKEVIEYHIIQDLVPFTEVGISGDYQFETLQGKTTTSQLDNPERVPFQKREIDVTDFQIRIYHFTVILFLSFCVR